MILVPVVFRPPVLFYRCGIRENCLVTRFRRVGVELRSFDVGLVGVDNARPRRFRIGGIAPPLLCTEGIGARCPVVV